MYPPIEAIERWAEAPWGPRRPLIMCEYSHAMGNSNGCLADYWDAIEAHRGLQGGFIWEWWDHGLDQELPDGRTRTSYGGDWGEARHDANFCCDGIAWPDRTPKPAMEEHKWLACPVTVAWASRARNAIAVTNRQDFADCSWLRAKLEVAVDGVVREAVELALPDLPAGASASVPMPVARPELAPGEAAIVTVRFRTARQLPWALAGYEVAWRQLEWARGRALGRAPATAGGVARGRGPALELHDGVLRSLPSAGASRGAGGLLDGGGPRFTLWRAPTDNDGIKLLAGQDRKPLGRWRSWGLDALGRELLDVEQPRPDEAVVRCAYLGADDVAILHTTRMRARTDGRVEFVETVEIPPAVRDVARIGIVCSLRPGLERLEWLGRGPHESYPDRARGAAIGRWRSTVTGEYVPYVVPQEHGLHVDTRWFTVTDARGAGVRFEALQPATFAFSALHHSAADLTGATHADELTARPETIVHVDHRHRGLGTLSCGPDTLEQYKIRPGTYTWSWRIQEVSRQRLVPA
jgi:beta-galactosidase